MKLTVKLPLIFIPMVAVPLVAVGALAYFQLRTFSQERSLEEITALLARTGEQFRQMTDTAKANAELISRDQQVLNYLLIEDEEERYSLYQRPLDNLFVGIQSVFPDYFELRILLPDGFEDLRVVNPYRENVSEEEHNTVYFQELREAATALHASMNINPDTGELALYISKKIVLINPATDSFNTEARLRGYLVTTVDLENWISGVKTETWGEAGGLILARDSGELLAVGSMLSPLAEELRAHLSSEQVLDPGSEHFHDLSLQGNNFHHLYRDLGAGLVLHALQPNEELVSASRRIAYQVTSILLIVMVLALPLLVMLLKSQVITPVQRLRRGLQNVGDGDELISLPTTARDELGDLNNAFNKMSTQLHESNEYIRTLAYQDTLTGLPNRLTFLGQVEREIALAGRNDTRIALLFLDLDNFKQINDTLGHEYGDLLLHDVAQRLSQHLRSHDGLGTLEHAVEGGGLARLGGDEFTILLSPLSSSMDAGIVAQRIIDLLAQPLELNDQTYYVGASIGIAIYPEDGACVEDLIKHADLAMYEAKKQGRNNYQYFSASISEQSRKRAQLDQKLHKAVENRDFILFYQQILNSRQCRVSYYEALIRWPDAEAGYISPDEFIPLAEENGTIGNIGDWVIDEAVRQLEEWQSGSMPEAVVSINVSGIQLSKRDFAQRLKQAMLARRVSPESLIIELTETAVIKGKQDVIDTLSSLRNFGIRIALDDFGTGYSSLSHLTSLPIDILKIDRSFISRFDDRESAAVLASIIGLAHALDLQVVAEGVELPEQAAFLTGHGCDYMQGYLFHRPTEAANIVPSDSVDCAACESMRACMATNNVQT